MDNVGFIQECKVDSIFKKQSVLFIILQADKEKLYHLSSCRISKTELDPEGLLGTETLQTVVSQVREGMQRQVRSRQDTVR